MNYKVVLDSGHGGNDSGAVGNGIVEKDLTLKISQYIHDRLDDLNVPNQMTRTEDTTLSPAERTKLIQSFYGNGEDVIVVSNHINAGGGDGAEIIYSLRNDSDLSSIIADELSKTPQNVRKYYQRRLPGDPSKDYYFIMRDTPNNETIIVEYGFIDSSGDDVDLLKNDWKELAEAVVKGLTEYMGVDYDVPNDSTYYTVKVGDTLWSIARLHNLTVEELKRLNNLSSNSLFIGQKLIVSDDKNNNPNEEEIYVVQAGDSLYSISKKFGLSVDELKAMNGLTSNLLSIGQKLIVKQNENNQEDYITYTVKPGDSLYRIALDNNTTVDALIQLNKLKSTSLNIGQILKIPGYAEEIVHTVVPGDTLYSIARLYNTTVDRIKEKNNLPNDFLSVGQKIIVF